MIEKMMMQVHSGIKAVLAEFGRVKPTVASGTINNAGGAGGAGSGDGQEELTVKYLSSPKLLNLEIRDAGFRRHFLGQCLILLQATPHSTLLRSAPLPSSSLPFPSLSSPEDRILEE